MSDDDYTPSTAQVRDCYVQAYYEQTARQSRAEFARWLAARDAARDESVRAEERERIAQRIEARMRENDASGAQVRAGEAFADAARIAREGA